MKAKTLQIVWHNKEPVYSVDFHPDGTLATGGADKEIKLWKVTTAEDGCASVEHLHTLAGHSRTVNCARFSPSGRWLVSSGDGGEMLLWQPKPPSAAPRGNLQEVEAEAPWRRGPVFRGHTDDVMDVTWSPDGTALLSGSIDNRAILWGMSEKRPCQILCQLASHKHFVQGVAWDPAQQLIATQSADRTCKIYMLRPLPTTKKTKVNQYLLPASDTAKEFYCAHTLSKRAMLPAKPEAGKAAKQPLFSDESLPSFFRRLCWSPDGALLVAPAGVSKQPGSRESHAAYVYLRGKWSAPLLALAGFSKPVIAARFCPLLFERDAAPPAAPEAGGEAGTAPALDLPYKMVFAVATLDSVALYDTQSAAPLVVLGHLHYDSITDLAWAPDGSLLAVSSRDAFCSLVVFEEGELGRPLPLQSYPPHAAKFAPAARRAAAAAAEEVAVQAGVNLTSPAPAAQPAAAAQHAAATPLPQSCVAAPVAAPAPASAPRPAPAAEEEPQAKRARRIVPEMVAPAAAQPAAADKPGAADAQPADAASAPATAASPAAPSAAAQTAKPARRIIPTRVDAAPSTAPPPVSAPAESSIGGSMISVGPTASAAKQAKRITPTPIKQLAPAMEAFGGAATRTPSAVAVEQTCESANPPPAPPAGRRITPMRIDAPSASRLTVAASVDKARDGAATASKPPRPNIAALALAAGQQAALESKQA